MATMETTESSPSPEPRPRRVTCLIGTGAVRGAWEPVLDAVRADGNTVTDSDAANCLMARVVFLARWACSKMFKDCGGTAEERRQVVEELTNLTTRIAERLQRAEACGRLSMQPEFRDIVERFVVDHEDEFAFITTTWDGTVERALREVDSRFAAGHLHGRSTAGSQLYLPTEVAAEPYRDESTQRDLTLRHRVLQDRVHQSAKLVIYGLSLSPLDAEVAQMLASGMHESASFREIVIVDPNHRLVATRLMTLLPISGPRIEITGYDPRDTRASAGVDYSLESR